jgi:uncharacterized protein YoaH (UPF0181 family)
MTLTTNKRIPSTLKTQTASVERFHRFISQPLSLGSVIKFLVFSVRKYRRGSVVLGVFGHCNSFRTG